ncbi:sensor histidine kinase, partial [Streptomyces sp. SID7499]|nr:sensor histidine kinase [Streptomyces sp. SID7499]
MQGDTAGIGGHRLPGPSDQDGSAGGDTPRVRPPSWPARCVGALLGCATAVIGLLHFLGAGTVLGAFLLWPLTRAGALGVLMAGARRLAALERARRTVFLGDRFPERY